MVDERGQHDDAGVPWDGGTWVEVGEDDKWTPTFEERARALVVLGIVLGVLFLAAAVASIGGDDDREVAVPSTEDTTTTRESTTTTAALDPASLDGDDPPEGCEDDDRNANEMRTRQLTTVLVLNGTPRGGHAGTSTDALDDLGYSTMAPDNANLREQTIVEYLPGFCAEAHRLVEDIDISGADFAAFEDGGDVFVGRARLVLTLGRDSL